MGGGPPPRDNEPGDGSEDDSDEDVWNEANEDGEGTDDEEGKVDGRRNAALSVQRSKPPSGGGYDLADGDGASDLSEQPQGSSDKRVNVYITTVFKRAFRI